MRVPRSLLAIALAGCGPAAFYDAETTGSDGEDAWREVSGEQIPPPIAQGWPLRGGDPDSDEQRVACVEQIDRSRVHVGRAIESAQALGAFERVRCLSDKAGAMKSLRLELAAPTLTDPPVDVKLACLTAQDLIFEARECR